MTRLLLTLIASLTLALGCSASHSQHAHTGAPAGQPAAPVFEGLALTTLAGQSLSGDSLHGKVVLVVNVASSCGYTGQYAGLQELYSAHESKGLVVLGVPCNQFGGQESGSSDEIQTFVGSKYGVTFPMLAKQEVKGSGQSPLFRRLMAGAADKDTVGWNFEKFLVGRDGSVIARFSSGTSPDDAELTTAITKALEKG